MKIHIRYFLIVFLLCVATNVFAEEWMPDPAFREAVREKLGIPADSPLTLTYMQLHLTNFNVIDYDRI